MLCVVYGAFSLFVTQFFQFIFLATERLCGLASPSIDLSAQQDFNLVDTMTVVYCGPKFSVPGTPGTVAVSSTEVMYDVTY